MKHSLPLFAFGLFILGTQSFAQTTPSSSNVGNLGASANTVPPMVQFSSSDASAMKSAAKFLMRRIHTIGIDSQFRDMEKTNTASKRFVAGFTVEGALAYNYELDDRLLHNDRIGQESEYAETGVNVGSEMFAYQLQFNTDGSKKVIINFVSLKNMNSLQHSKNAQTHATDILKVLDQLDVCTLMVDQHSTFDNLTTVDLDAVRVGLKVPFADDQHGNFVAVRGGGSIGLEMAANFTAGLPAPLATNSDSPGLFNGTYYGGLEANIQRENGFKLNVQSNYVGGGGGVPLVDTQSIATNKANIDAHSAEWTNWNNGKWEMIRMKQQYLTDEQYAAITGLKIPAYSIHHFEEKPILTRNYGYIRSSVDVSRAINKSGHPMRLGIAAEYNVGLRDNIQGDNGVSIDMLPHLKQQATAKLYLNF